MAAQQPRPKLSVGNHIYLYQLLSSTIGCGKQTLAPKIEEVLAAERMTAEDLGYESTRALLEELSDFVTLTVFKGGRVYATVNAQPAWDEALAATDKTDAPQPKKAWKRKKTDKSLKPVKPRRVKREEPEPEPEAAAEPAPASEPASEPATMPDAIETSPVADAVPETESPDTSPAAGSPTGTDAADQPDVEGQAPVDTASGNGAPDEPCNEADASPAPIEEETAQPAITLTVVYDPENANAGMTTLESTPGITPADLASHEVADGTGKSPAPAETAAVETDVEPPASAPAEMQAETIPERAADAAQPNAHPDEAPSATEHPAAQTAVDEACRPVVSGPATDTAPTPQPVSGADAASAAPACQTEQSAPSSAAPEPEPEPVLPAGYPEDFTRDVYCPGELLREISYLLPYGADVLGILNEYYYIAQLRRTLAAARNHATFPFAYTRDGERRWSTVRIKRSATASGTSWVIDRIEDAE